MGKTLKMTSGQEVLISVIMPAYNAEKYIAASIQSVIGQTYRNWELIVVDDGSTDRTAEIVCGFSQEEKRIKYIFQQNKKLAKARNEGINNSSAEIVAFLDSDDLWIKEKLDLQIKAMADSDADLVFSDGFIFVEDDTENEASAFSIKSGIIVGAKMFKSLMARNQIPVLSVMVKKKIIERAGGFDESPVYHYGAEDYDLWVRIAGMGARFYGMSERLVRYRIHSASMSSKAAELLKAELTVVEKYYKSSNCLNGLEKGIVKSRISSLRSRAAITTLDKYFLETRKGNIVQALLHLWEALRLKPIAVFQPRRFGAVLKNGARALATAVFTRMRRRSQGFAQYS